jgi:hypothetical protein
MSVIVSIWIDCGTSRSSVVATICWDWRLRLVLMIDVSTSGRTDSCAGLV